MVGILSVHGDSIDQFVSIGEFVNGELELEFIHGIRWHI